MPQRQILGAVGGGFAAASQRFHVADFFFFITCQTWEPFVAQVSQNWMVAQWSMYALPVWRVVGSIPGKGTFYACQFLSIVAQTFAFLGVRACDSLCFGLVFETCAAFGK